ncbi:MAG: HD domain-containing protein [Clostridia bacterium]|nr:HD domain-containing protein [Clostridia bacterium]
MEIRVSAKLHNLASACPFPLYIVGGYIRDALAGICAEAQDIDICAPVSADEFLAVAKSCGAEVDAVYRNTGTVKLGFGKEKYEFTCFRSDEYVRGIHTPVKTFFTDDIMLDARRRDFKCNAVYYDIAKGELCDPLGGIDDIKNKRMSTVADADKVFGEDGLRLMRLARQAAQLNFTPTEECLAGAKSNCALISDISVERVYAELDAILHAEDKYGFDGAAYRGLKILDETRVLDGILPELTLGRGMAQNEKYHAHDVLEHSLRTVLYADKEIRLAALLHDIGKPRVFIDGGNYYGHENIGADIAETICTRLKVSKKLTAEVVRLTKLHMYDLKGDARESKIRKIIVANKDIFDKLLMIKQADFSACRDDLSEAPCVTKWREIYGKMLSEGAPTQLKQLEIRGDELISAGVPAKEVGKVLEELLYECALNPALNDKKTLLARIQKLKFI